MTVQELFASLSEVLVHDEEVLTVREKELLANVVQRAKARDRAADDEVLQIIAQAIGDTIAQRAAGKLGNRITEQILHSPLLRPPSTATGMGTPSVPPPSSDPRGPRPPSPGPPAPGISHPERSLGGPRPPSPGPPAPGAPVAPKGPLPPSTGPRPKWLPDEDEGRIAISQIPRMMPAACVVLDEFLMPSELEALLNDTLAREDQFVVSEVISPGVNAGLVDFEHRRSRVLYDLGAAGLTLVQRVQECLPRVLAKLDREMFPISRLEAQITASNHGDFFKWHCDDGQAEVARREITFVYFFHREPKEFRGGELRIHNSVRENGGYIPAGDYRSIVPQQNQLVIFPSALAHEITPVECPAGTFASSRFTLNGWFHR